MPRQAEDGSILSDDGKVLAFSADRFIQDIVKGDSCFICGVSPSAAQFDREHILSDWILSRYQLYKRKIGLPNDVDFTYRKYTVPCCEPCNKQLSRLFETPISKLLAGGYQAVYQHLTAEGPMRLFVWLTLIFVKTHLKDREFRVELDLRKPDVKIAEGYAWEDLHHAHCVARSWYSLAALDPGVIGSLLVLPARTDTHFEDFDYADRYRSQTMLLRLGDVAFLAVMNDAGHGLQAIQPLLSRITGPLSPAQIRELMAHLAFVNLHLTARPTFTSRASRDGQYYIDAAVPPATVDDSDRKDFGVLMESLCGEFLDHVPEEQREVARAGMRQGRYSYLFRPDGSFASNSL